MARALAANARVYDIEVSFSDGTEFIYHIMGRSSASGAVSKTMGGIKGKQRQLLRSVLVRPCPGPGCAYDKAAALAPQEGAQE